MVRPANFRFNEETAENNAFQTDDGSMTNAELREAAIVEFDAFVEKLRAVGVDVTVAEDTALPVKPDAVFPNNWVTFHQDGTIVTYPMFATARRLERRADILEKIQDRFRVERKIQLEEYETIDQYLEGTGSMIIDRPNRLVYACLSPRTTLDLLQRFCKLMNYEAVPFHATDQEGIEIYHTNVMMALGETFVVICFDTVVNATEKALLKQKFTQTNKEVIEISHHQMMNFAGNMLQVKNKKGETYLVMSEQAYQSLEAQQISKILRHTNILYSPIPTIETYGGGSARCMLAEIFLPEKG